MLRKILRSIARKNMRDQGIDIFGKYAPKETKVRNKRTGKFEMRVMQKSYFSRSWRAWCHD